jgi:hypothetical protein
MAMNEYQMEVHRKFTDRLPLTRIQQMVTILDLKPGVTQLPVDQFAEVLEFLTLDINQDCDYCPGAKKKYYTADDVEDDEDDDED